MGDSSRPWDLQHPPGAVLDPAGASFLNVESYGAIGDGSSHLLSSKFATLADAQVVYPHATALTNEIDWCAIQGAINALSLSGGTVYIPQGIYLVHNRIDVLGGVQLLGSSLDYGGVAGAVARGSVIRASSAYVSGFGVVRLGTALTNASGFNGASARHLISDAAGVGSAAFEFSGRRGYLDHCQAYRGTAKGVACNGQNSYIHRCVIGQNQVGDGININGDDVKIFATEIREAGGASIQIVAGSDIQIIGNHMYYTNASSGSAYDVRYSGTGLVRRLLIANNFFDTTRRNHILLAPGASTTLFNTIIADNIFFMTTDFLGGFASIALDVTAASSKIDGLAVTGNQCDANGSSNNFTAFLEKVGAGGTIVGDTINGNVAADVAAFLLNYTPTAKNGNLWRAIGGAYAAG